MSAPNIGEKIAATYLRLNGFLLLNHFTIFIEYDGRRQRHIDILGLRAGGSVETPFNREHNKLDDEFFDRIKIGFQIEDPKAVYIGAGVQVKTNAEEDYLNDAYCNYAKSFLGDAAHLIPIAFSRTRRSKSFCLHNEPSAFKGTLVINLDYALGWVLERIDYMKELGVPKTESWYLSEEFMSDILILRELGLPARAT